jgi:hypothetical protein
MVEAKVIGLMKMPVGFTNMCNFAAVALAFNTRPRKTLEWKTPAEALGLFPKSIHT